MKKTIRVAAIKEDSLGDGPGCRTVLFLQGCDIHCDGCHNPSTWNPDGGTEYEISDLCSEIRAKSCRKKLTISGGEPLLQKDAVLELCKALQDFDICLYTGHDFKEIPEALRKYLSYVKFGPFKKELLIHTQAYYGSSNQTFREVKKDA
ncbi:radical SAM protein [bacterium]|nr:radical SAM protein [bacterium]